MRLNGFQKAISIRLFTIYTAKKIVHIKILILRLLQQDKSVINIIYINNFYEGLSVYVVLISYLINFQLCSIFYV